MKVADKIFLAVGIINGFFVTAQWSFFIYAQHRYSTLINDASAIGVIGSSDGPTAIFISNVTGVCSTLVIILQHSVLLFSMVFLIVRRVQRNHRK